MSSDLLYVKSNCICISEVTKGRYCVSHLLGRMHFTLTENAFSFLLSFSKPRLLSSLSSIERKWAKILAEGLLIRPFGNDEEKRIRSIYQTSLYKKSSLLEDCFYSKNNFTNKIPSFIKDCNEIITLSPGFFSLNLGNGTYLASVPYGNPVHIDKQIYRLLLKFKRPTTIQCVAGEDLSVAQCLWFLLNKKILTKKDSLSNYPPLAKEDIHVDYPIDNRWRQKYQHYSLGSFKTPIQHRLKIVLLGPCNIQLVAEALEYISYARGISPEIYSVLQPEELINHTNVDICICSGLPYASDFFKSYLTKYGLIEAQSKYIARTDDLIQEIRKYSTGHIFVLSISPQGLLGKEKDSPFFYYFREKIAEANKMLSELFAKIDNVHMIDYSEIEKGHLGYFWDDIFNGSLHHSALSTWQWVSLKPSFAHKIFDNHEITKNIPPVNTFQQDPAESISISLTDKFLYLLAKKIKVILIDGDDLLWDGRTNDPKTIFEPPVNFYADVEKYFYSGIHEALFRIKQSGVKLICLSTNVPLLQKRWKKSKTEGFFIQPQDISYFLDISNGTSVSFEQFQVDESDTCWISVYHNAPSSYKGMIFKGNRWDLKKALLNHPSISSESVGLIVNQSKNERKNKNDLQFEIDEIKPRFNSILCKILECSLPFLDQSNDLRSLGLDSLQGLHLLEELENEFNITFPETAYTDPVVFNKNILFQYLRNAIQEIFSHPQKITQLKEHSSVLLIDRVFFQLKNSQHPWMLQINNQRGAHFLSGQSLLASISEMIVILKNNIKFNRGETVLLVITNEENFIALFLACLKVGLIPVLTATPDNKIKKEWSRKFAKRHCIPLVLFDESTKNVNSPKVLGFKINCDIPAKKNKNLPLFYLTSSGTTGEAKLIAHTNETVLSSINSLINSLDVTNGDTIVSWMPIHHTIGMVNHFLMPLINGIKSILFNPIIFSQQPERFLRCLAENKNSISFMPCFAFSHLYKHVSLAKMEGKRLHQVKALICAGEFIDADILESFYFHFGPLGFRQSSLLTGYGMAETAGVVTQSKPYHVAPVIRINKNKFLQQNIIEPVNHSNSRSLVLISSGRIINKESIRIATLNKIDDNLTLGSIMVKLNSLSPSVQPLLDKDGYYLTGDRGFLYKDNLYVVNREKDILIIAGKNIAPQIIEKSYVKLIDNIRTLAFDWYVSKKGTRSLAIYFESDHLDKIQKEEFELKIRKRILADTKITVAKFLYSKTPLLKYTKSGKLIRNASIESIINKLGLL